MMMIQKEVQKLLSRKCVCPLDICLVIFSLLWFFIRVGKTTVYLVEKKEREIRWDVTIYMSVFNQTIY